MTNSKKITKRFVSDRKTYRVVMNGKSVTLFLQGSKEVLVGSSISEGESLLSAGKSMLEYYQKTKSLKTIEEMFG